MVSGIGLGAPFVKGGGSVRVVVVVGSEVEGWGRGVCSLEMEVIFFIFIFIFYLIL